MEIKFKIILVDHTNKNSRLVMALNQKSFFFFWKTENSLKLIQCMRTIIKSEL